MGWLFHLWCLPNLECADQSFIPSWLEQIHTMEVAQRARHLTVFQAYRNDKDPAILQKFCLFERDLEFLMTETRLFIEGPRKTDKNQIATEDRPADLMRPVLSRLKVLCVQPGIDSIPDQAVVKFTDSIFIGVSIN